jgi:hypothetical protein
MMAKMLAIIRANRETGLSQSAQKKLFSLLFRFGVKTRYLKMHITVLVSLVFRIAVVAIGVAGPGQTANYEAERDGQARKCHHPCAVST